MVAARAGLKRQEEKMRTAGLAVQVVDQETGRAQVLDRRGVPGKSLPEPGKRPVFLAVLGDRGAADRVVNDLAAVVQVRRNRLRLDDRGDSLRGGERAVTHSEGSGSSPRGHSS